MEEVALCLRFMDLLRQDFPAVGEGMAEASCCPLRLVGTIPLPFIPLDTGMPLNVSRQRNRKKQKQIIKRNVDLSPFFKLTQIVF